MQITVYFMKYLYIDQPNR